MNGNQLFVGTSISLEKGENGRIWELLLSPLVFLLPTSGLPLPYCSRVPHLLPLSPTALVFGSGSTFPRVGISLFVSALSFQPVSQGLFSPSGVSDIWSLGALVVSGACRWWAWVSSHGEHRSIFSSTLNTWREGTRFCGLD